MPFPPLVEPVPALSAAEQRRTARHRSLAALGDDGQRRLAAGHVAIVGAGGLGSPAVLALAAAGVGTLTVIDDDDVELTNLQRQVIHRLSDVGAPKVDSAVRVAGEIAPEVRVRAIRERLTDDSAARLLEGADVVLDGSDLFSTRSAVAAACATSGTPLVWGTVQETDAQLTVFWSRPPAGVAPVVLDDLYPADRIGEPPTCAAVGVLGPLCLQLGALMATQAIALLAGVGDPLVGRLLLIDALGTRFREIPLRGAPQSREGGATSRPRTVTASDSPAHPIEIVPVDAAAAELAGPAAPIVIDVREAEELEAGIVPGSRHIPLADLLDAPERVAREVGDRPVLIVCQIGGRARRAATALAPFTRARVLDGGYAAWREREDAR
ncbi:adenylyltransferase/sulfurtransferase MoeZ [Microbacterium barkeri]|uniref:Adenylyltransferase/sulfurtransferase MoeZ n=1 Tax=Microbacterium barkeri TaxID=33917 RepID=A0A9W6H0V1_9MICO|nr:ThiF family adenylyltransferase [Microbacterium barkeri]MDR6876096.1 adenylyltransferase/sulfurtransferase [Microbacterium barkeri]GLJ60213.1 adenylyltransferase/sulfurtransferase MoeZ [Microbacterium barkeri]